MPIHFAPHKRKGHHFGPDLRIVRYNKSGVASGNTSIQCDVFANPRFSRPGDWQLKDGDRVTLVASEDGTWKVIKARDGYGYVVRQKVLRGLKTPCVRIGMTVREARQVFGATRELSLTHLASNGDSALFAMHASNIKGAVPGAD